VCRVVQQPGLAADADDRPDGVEEVGQDQGEGERGSGQHG
jgi:hypothetical protein